MRKYIVTLLVLGLIGAGVAVQFFTQGQRLDQTVYLRTTESIRSLQTLDKDLRLLLNQSRFNSKFEHHRLRDVNFELSAEFDNLRFEALFEEIESSPRLSSTVTAFEQAFTNRDALLEQYITENMRVIKDLLAINATAPALQSSAELKQQPELYSSIVDVQSKLFALTLGEDLEGELELADASQALPRSVERELFLYRNAVADIHRGYTSAEKLYEQLFTFDTDELLNQIESDYAAYHKTAIEGSNSLRNALVAYGVILLVVLMFFAYKIWRNYISLEQQIAERTEEIKQAYEELRESQQQLIQSEKMASLGQMVAGVAHEINTPLGYVSSNVGSLKMNLADISAVLLKAKALAEEFEKKDRDSLKVSQHLSELIKTEQELESIDLVEESQELLDDGLFGLNEISKLVKSLKDFSRLDRQAVERIDVHDCIESSLTIASNPIKENEVTVVREFGELPKIDCSPSKLNQLFLNIITNACQAMEARNGSLTVRTNDLGGEVRIDFIDQGVGMDEETRSKMFDPFFTSKEIGQGTGMGMSIAYRIIEEHNGRIDVDSVENEGTTVSIFLPSI